MVDVISHFARCVFLSADAAMPEAEPEEQTDPVQEQPEQQPEAAAGEDMSEEEEYDSDEGSPFLSEEEEFGGGEAGSSDEETEPVQEQLIPELDQLQLQPAGAYNLPAASTSPPCRLHLDHFTNLRLL